MHYHEICMYDSSKKKLEQIYTFLIFNRTKININTSIDEVCNMVIFNWTEENAYQMMYY